MDNSVSPLASGGSLILWSVLMLLALYWNQGILAALFLAFFLIAGLAQLWAHYAIRGVTLQLDCPKSNLFPGETTKLHYQIRNDKLIPLPWLEVIQNGPAKECLLPGADYEKLMEPGQTLPSYRTTFSFVRGYQTIDYELPWQANRRGIYTIDHLRARSGDGLGLVQRSSTLPMGQTPTIAVYPRLVPVDLGIFLKAQWDTASRRHGFLEDKTILQGSREYQPGDSWRSINWRMAAREQGLPVNLYQSITPYRLHFILDGESFLRHRESLEDVLEVLASVILALSQRNMTITLTLPRSTHYPAMTCHCEENGDVSEIFFYLAAYECLAAVDPDKEMQQGTPTYLPSIFPEDMMSIPGTQWLITWDGSQLPEEILRQSQASRLQILCMEKEEVPRLLGLSSVSILDLKR